MTAGIVGQGTALAGTQGQGCFDAIAKIPNIIRFCQPTRLFMNDGFRCASMIKGDHWPAHGLCLKRNPTKRFWCDRWHDHNIRNHQSCWHILNRADQTEPTLQPQFNTLLGNAINE